MLKIFAFVNCDVHWCDGKKGNDDQSGGDGFAGVNDGLAKTISASLTLIKWRDAFFKDFSCMVLDQVLFYKHNENLSHVVKLHQIYSR